MKDRRRIACWNLLAVASLTILFLASGQAQQPDAAQPQPDAAKAQQPAPASSTAPTTFKVETRVVLVDAVVTDKKGNYIRDLAATDFKIWEDGKEQPVSSFSRENNDADPAHAARHYLVLFFDYSTMEFGDQAKAREAAAKFIDSNAGPNQLIAIVEFGGMLRIAQNFTSDADRLKKLWPESSSRRFLRMGMWLHWGLRHPCRQASLGRRWAGWRPISERAAFFSPCAVWPKAWPTCRDGKPWSC